MELGPASSKKVDWALAGWVSLLTLIHIFLAGYLPLAEDETYYWEWSRSLDWGYFDQGPMIAWVIRLFCSLFGETVWGVRAGAILCSAGWMLMAYVIVGERYGRQAGRLAALAIGAAPLTIVGGFIFTYDSLLVLFWTAAIWLLGRAVERGGAGWWLAAGAAVGLGMLAKLTMAFFLPCGLIYLISSPRHRPLLRSPWPWVAALLAFLLYLPALAWQARHDWVTFRHVASISGASQGNTTLERVGELIGSQLLALGPALFFVLIAALVWGWRSRREQGEAWLYWCFSAPVLLYFLASAVRAKVLANWPGFGWIGACLLAGAWAVRTPRRSKVFGYSLALGAALLVPVIFPQIPEALGAPIPVDLALPMNRMYGGKELGEVLARLREERASQGGEKPILCATDYQEAARIGFYTPGRPRAVTLFIEVRSSQYAYWNPPTLPAGASALLVLPQPIRDKQRPIVRRLFEGVDEPPTVLPIRRSGFGDRPVRTYWIYHLTGFRPEGSSPYLKPPVR